MKKIWNSLVLAFSIYSIGPSTKVENTKENTKYILMFIPFIGAIIGFIISRWAIGYPYLFTYAVLPAVVGAILPSLLSAGSHLDGFFRTVDALSSKKTREHKLRILEDSHGGYFAIIFCVWYFMLAIGVWSEMPVDGLFVLAFTYVISRSLFGFSILTLEHAKASKCSIYVPTGALRVVEATILLAFVIISCIGMIKVDRQVGTACILGVFISYAYYYYVAKKHFGGITKDLAGFFVQVCEIVVPIAALFAYKKWW